MVRIILIFMVTFFRAIKWAVRSFWRHLGLSFVTIIIITLSLLSLNLLLFLNLIGKTMVINLQNRVDISIYLKDNLNQTEIDSFYNEFKSDPQIKEIVYISSEQALAKFKERHKNDEFILKSLEAINKNPLGGMMVLKAASIEAYPSVLTKISDVRYDKYIEEKDFFEHEKIIGIIKNISQKAYFAGLIILAVFTFISVVAIFNSIRLTVYTREEEIKIMRLIGATSSFARAPLIIENIFYGIFAWLINLGIFALIFKFGLEKILNFLEIEKSLFLSFQQEITSSFLAVLVFSILLTIICGSLAVRKYIRT